jgi:hypothetical protein
MNNHTSSSVTVCCPKCKCDVVRRVPRPALVKSLFGFVPLRRYQCLSCLSTFAGPVVNAKRVSNAEPAASGTAILMDNVLNNRTAYPVA